MRYPIVIHKDLESAYGVIVPDLPGCFSAGDTLDEAVMNAREAIECHLEGLLKDADPLPMPQPLEAHQGAPDYADGVWALVEVDLGRLQSKSQRINVSMPERLLHLVDAAAKRAGESRSGFLAKAAVEYIGRHRAP